MKKYLKIILLVCLTLTAIGLVAGYFFQAGPIFFFTAGWLVIITLLLWIGNQQLTVRLDKIMPWKKFGNWRFFTQLILALFYLLFLINSIYYGIKVSLTNDPPSEEQLVVMNLWGAVIFIPLFSLYFSLHFLRHWRKSELLVEIKQKESMHSQLESLKNHLDPHFLFNNLNILASLVESNQSAAKEFIQKFAEVYRSLLRTKSDDLITLREELEFIQSYMYLLHVRFQDLIVFKATIQNEQGLKLIPPLTVQMLVENAIKHNVISELKPLHIELSDELPNYLIVRNTLRPKKQLSDTMGSGLINIQQRYAHFTDMPVIVEKTTDLFSVHIPLIEMQKS